MEHTVWNNEIFTTLTKNYFVNTVLSNMRLFRPAWNRPLSCYLVSWMVLSKNWRFLIVFVQIQKTEANFPPKIRTSFANFHGRNSACKQTSTSDTTTFFNDLWWSPIQSNSTEITEAILESKWRSKNGRFLTKFLS